MTDNSFEFHPDSFAGAIFLQTYNKYSTYAPIFSNSDIFDALFSEMTDFSNKIYQQYKETQDIERIKSLLELSITAYLETVIENVSRSISVDQYISKTQIITSSLMELIDENSIIQKPFSYMLIKILLLKKLYMLNDPDLVSLAKVFLDNVQTDISESFNIREYYQELAMTFKMQYEMIYHPDETSYVYNMTLDLCSIAETGIQFNLGINNSPENKKLFSTDRIKFLMNQISWAAHHFGFGIFCCSPTTELEAHYLLSAIASEIWSITFNPLNKLYPFKYLEIIVQERCETLYYNKVRPAS